MTVEIEIKEAPLQEAEEILILQKLAYQSEAQIINDYTIQPLTQSLKEIKEEFHKQTFFAAYHKDNIVGSIRTEVKAQTCYINKLIVHPNFQNSGLGTRLLQTAETHRHTIATSFQLFTGEKSTKNRYFYEKHGYTLITTETISQKLTLVHYQKLA